MNNLETGVVSKGKSGKGVIEREKWPTDLSEAEEEGLKDILRCILKAALGTAQARRKRQP